MTWMKVEKETKLRMVLKNPQGKDQRQCNEDLSKVDSI